MAEKNQSLYSKLLGRSLFSIVFGNFFENKNNAASIIALLLVFAICYIVVIQQKYEYVQYLLNALFVVIGYYFGLRQIPMQLNDDDNI